MTEKNYTHVEHRKVIVDLQFNATGGHRGRMNVDTREDERIERILRRILKRDGR
ncbi:MAG: hypothetical protein ACREER_13280 [Alphaproteobacteria bacterium]